MEELGGENPDLPPSPRPLTDWIDISRNLSERERQRTNEPDAFDGQMLWVLWRHIRRADRRRRLAAGVSAREDREEDEEEEEDSEDEEDSDDDDGPQGRNCAQS